MVGHHQRTGQLVIRVLHSDLPRGLASMATRDERAVTVRLSRHLEPRDQRLTLAVTLKAARRAGWIRRGVPAVVLAPFTLSGSLATARRLTGRLLRAHGTHAAFAASAAAMTGAVAVAIILPPGPHTRTGPGATGPGVAPSIAPHARQHRSPQHTRLLRQRHNPAGYQVPVPGQPRGVSSSRPAATSTSPRAPQPSPATSAPVPSPSPTSPQPSPSSSPSAGVNACITVIVVGVCVGV